MKIIRIILIFISFSAPLYAANLNNTYGGAMSQGITQGIQNAYQIQQMRMIEEQRRMLEQQRFMMQQEEQRRVEQHRLIMEQQKLGNVEKDVNQIKLSRFIEYMDIVVPDWRTVDRDPAFIEWLQAPAPYTRATKFQLLRAAAAEYDAETTAQFFLDFKAATR